MRTMRATQCCGALLIALAALFSSQPSYSDGAYATGADWTASSQDVKLAYLLGISNLMSAEYQVQRRNGRTGGSAVAEMYGALENVSIDQAVTAIDGYFEANPDKLDDTVLDVVWLTLVER